MKLQELQSERAEPLEIVHDTRWLSSLLARSPVPTSTAPRETSADGLRTVVAVSTEQREAAEALVRRRYEARGYRAAAQPQPSLATEGIPRHRVTLLAQNCGRLLGTLSIIPDSASGLLGEMSYGAEIRSMRAEGHRLGELVKLAIVEGADWKSPLDALVQSAYLVTRVMHGLTDVLIEVNPRHVPFYRRVFGFVQAGGHRLCERVGAPSALMRLDLEQFGRRLSLPAS